MRKKAALLLILILSFCLFLPSCSTVGGDIDALLEAPKLTGDMYEIQNAVEAWAGGEIDLRYPKKGEYLSAFVLYDVDNDDVEEAVAFYSMADDSATGEIHISFADKTVEGNWSVVGSVPVSAVGVEQVSFADLDGNGQMEVVVGWNIFSALEKQVAVYTASADKFTQRLLENYTEYVICDIMEAGYSQLLTINLNLTEKTSVAKLYHLEGSGITEEGSAALDGSVTGYLTPVVAKLASGKPAVYVDATKGTSSMITEILYFQAVDTSAEKASADTLQIAQSSALMSPFHDGATNENEITSRPTTVEMWDVDGDGVMEMPLMTALPGFSSRTDDEKLYYTAWRHYDEKKFETVLTAVMNYAAGYYIQYPDKWLEGATSKITVSRNADSSVFQVSVWNAEALLKETDLFRIQQFTHADWENRDMQEYASYFVVRSDKDYVYAACIMNRDHALSLDEAGIESSFVLLNTRADGAAE